MKNTPWTFNENDFHIRDNDGNTIALVKIGVAGFDLLDLIATGHLMASAPTLIRPPTPTEPSESSDPSPLQKLLELIAHLPPGLRADWDGTNHYELVTSFSDTDYWWLTLSDYLVKDLNSATADGKRIGLLLDLAETAKAAEQHLQNIHVALAELNQRNGLNNDKDAYLLALVEWAQGQRPARPDPQSFGQPPLA